jgi:hypothetical protein
MEKQERKVEEGRKSESLTSDLTNRDSQKNTEGIELEEKKKVKKISPKCMSFHTEKFPWVSSTTAAYHHEILYQ